MRPAASGMAEAMVYVDIVSEANLDLVGASTPVARRVELVDVNLKTDPPESKVVASMPVAAGKARLAYRGSHLRLVGINKDLGNGASVPLTLMFKSADGKEVRASVDAQVRGLLTPQQMPAVVSRDPEPAARNRIRQVEIAANPAVEVSGRVRRAVMAVRYARSPSAVLVCPCLPSGTRRHPVAFGDLDFVGNFGGMREHDGRRAVFLLRQLHGALDLGWVQTRGRPLCVPRWMRVKTLGSSVARSASAVTTQSVTGCRPFFRISTTSKAVHAAVPVNTISIGRMPRLRPPCSGAPR